MSEDIHTLQEFLLHTKGMLYLLVILFLVGFVYFWRFLHDRDKDDG